MCPLSSPTHPWPPGPVPFLFARPLPPLPTGPLLHKSSQISRLVLHRISVGRPCSRPPIASRSSAAAMQQVVERLVEGLLSNWHSRLGLARHSKAWYRARLQEELHERRCEPAFWRRLSESSDVLYAISRARHDGCQLRRPPPFSLLRHGPLYLYFVCKCSSRWAFYRAAARLCGAPHWPSVREVVNPARDSKLRRVAARHGIDSARFVAVGRRLRRVWPLLP